MKMALWKGFAELIKCLMEGKEGEKLCNRMNKLKEIKMLLMHSKNMDLLQRLFLKALKWRNLMHES
jgi:uncharacterized ferredoxin-like protein